MTDPFEGIEGCTNGGCLIRKPTGMHTNGVCSCSRDSIKMHKLIALHRAQHASMELPDADEMGRRFRAAYRALTSHGPHDTIFARYKEDLKTVDEYATLDPNAEGTWGWWARLITPPRP